MRLLVLPLALWFIGNAALANQQPRLVQRFAKATFKSPTFITAAGDDELWVLEQRGRILALKTADSSSAPRLVLDISRAVSTQGDEEGLLGLAIAPDFIRSGIFYLYYSRLDKMATQLSRFRFDKKLGVALPESEFELLTILQPYRNHNGGMIAFGKDGYLYVGVGDGGAAGDPHNHGQNKNSLLGKILRLEVGATGPYRVPPDNPFVNQPNARPEIWAYGLRNPWRFSFDRQSGALWVGDVGQNLWEEINVVEAGDNYGWRLKEGNHDFRPVESLAAKALKPPRLTYPHQPSGGYSVTGGYVYRGKSLPKLKGHYIYGDFVTGNIWGYEITSGKQQRIGRLANLSSFGEDQQGELYLLNWREGTIWQLASH